MEGEDDESKADEQVNINGGGGGDLSDLSCVGAPNAAFIMIAISCGIIIIATAQHHPPPTGPKHLGGNRH